MHRLYRLREVDVDAAFIHKPIKVKKHLTLPVIKKKTISLL
jgi:hypothetical protein